MRDLSQMNSELGHRFSQHLFALNSDITPAESRTLWLDIATHYNETARAYHSLRHIQQLFFQFEHIRQHLHQPHIIALALYYHDVIYNPMRSDNEIKSAEYMSDKLAQYLNDQQCQHIYDLIMMTATHQLTELADKDNRSDAAYFLDMDLSILGMPWPEYEHYAQAIRQEYAHVPMTDYKTGRTQVLQTLLAHPRLYLTEHYQQLETQARSNIEHEINLLRAS
ncbi:HD domain-containing protein [Psychrobacter alimentarius]|uniref:HD domain-containing protein n=1 Tax=Psychrobacter alimentarius TaxID=261164 RepID=UPI00334E19F5